MIAAHHYTKEDEEYGTYEEKEYEETTEEQYICPNCQAQVPDELMSQREINEFSPEEHDVPVMDALINDQEILCPECLVALDPALQKSPLIVTRFSRF